MNTPTNSVDSELENLFVELIDKHYPKGDKGRGKAMVLVAEALQAINNLYIKREEVERAIGEDEKVKGSPFEKSFYTTRNQIRAELRAKLLTPKEGNNDTL